MKALIHYYEESDQFNSEAVEFISYDRLSLVKRVSEKLNAVYAYRPTEQDLWATIWIDGEQAYQIDRVSDEEVIVLNRTTGERYPFYPHKEYSI